MKLFFRIIFKIFFILTFLAGNATTEEIKETDPIALLNQGIALGGDRGIAYFNKAIEINPRFAEAYYIRGRAYYYKGWYDKAIADYTMVIELNPRFAWAYHNRANAYYHKGQYDKACSDWRQACELGSCVQYELAKTKGVCK